MATVYVSQTATNGYGVGNDTTGDGSKSTPYLTLTKALTVTNASDTVVLNDGTYSEVGFLNPADANLTINAENRHGAIIQTANGADIRVFHLQADTTGITFGEIVIDAQNTQASCVTDGAVSTGGISATFSGTKFLNPTTQFFSFTRCKNITLDGNWVAQATSLSSAGFGFQHTTANDGAAGTISITDGQMTISSITTSSRGGILVSPTDVAGVDLTIQNVTINITANASGTIVYGIKAAALQSAVIETNTINLYTSATPQGIIVNNSAVDNIDTCRIATNTVTTDQTAPTSGYGILVGDDQDTAPAARDSITKAKVFGNVLTGVNHGVIASWVTSAELFANKIETCAYGTILKGTTTCFSYGNVIINPTLNGILYKGDTNGIAGNNTIIYKTGASVSSAQSIRAAVSGVTNCSGCKVYNNNIYSDAAIDSYVSVAASQVCNFDANNYYMDTNGSLASDPWAYQGTTYATVALWNAAATVGTDLSVDPEIVDITNGNYAVGNSSLKAVGFKWWTGGDPEGYGGEPFLPIDVDIGAIQTTDATNHPFHPLNL